MVAQERYHLSFAAQIAVLAAIGSMTLWMYWNRPKTRVAEALPT